jgi:hypothetical protein
MATGVGTRFIASRGWGGHRRKQHTQFATSILKDGDPLVTNTSGQTFISKAKQLEEKTIDTPHKKIVCSYRLPKDVQQAYIKVT